MIREMDTLPAVTSLGQNIPSLKRVAPDTGEETISAVSKHTVMRDWYK